MQRTILDKKELIERWGISYKTLEAYEKEGYIRRLNLPGAKFSLSSIEKLEYDGTDNLLMRKDQIIREQNLRIQELESKIEMIKGVIT